MRDLVIKKGVNLNSKKVVIIPNWADVNDVSPMDKSSCFLVQKHQLYNCFIVQYSGNHGRTHDLVSLVKAAEELKNYKEIVFLFIGAGSGKKALIEYVQKNNLQNMLFQI